jgi:hypothetical protein
MAIKRSLNRQAKFAYPHEVHLHARCAIGAAGAVGVTTGRYVTFAKSATGVYTATVENTGGLIDWLWVDAKVVGSALSLRPRCSINASMGVVTITVEGADGTTDTDPADGTSLCVSIVAVNATVA